MSTVYAEKAHRCVCQNWDRGHPVWRGPGFHHMMCRVASAKRGNDPTVLPSLIGMTPAEALEAGSPP